MSSWSCPEQIGETCLRMKKPCKPGMKGCVLKGKVEFAPVDPELAKAPPRRPPNEDRTRRGR